MDPPSSSTVVTRAPPSDKPIVLLLSLAAKNHFNQQYAPLINTLNERTTEKGQNCCRRDTIPRIHTPSAIIITDQGFTQPYNKAVIEKIIAYMWPAGWLSWDYISLPIYPWDSF